LKEFNPTGVTNFNNSRTFSRPLRQVQEIGGPRSSQQEMTAGSLSLPTGGRTNSTVRSSSNLQSLTRGAASFLAARKQQSSHSNASSTCTSHSPKTGEDTDENSTRKVASSNSLSDSLLLDDLPCDFDDFSDDNNECMDSDSIQAQLPDRGNFANASLHHVAREEMDVGDVSVNSLMRSDKTAPKESSFFNKLCEGM
jgi:hypothetical protein